MVYKNFQSCGYICKETNYSVGVTLQLKFTMISAFWDDTM